MTNMTIKRILEMNFVFQNAFCHICHRSLCVQFLINIHFKYSKNPRRKKLHVFEV